MSLLNYSASVAAVLVTVSIFLTRPDGAQAVRRPQTPYVNKYRKPFSFECSPGQLLSDVFSLHKNKHQDRRWRLGCVQAPGGANAIDCQWTQDFVNAWDAPVQFLCPTNYALAGVASEYNKKAKDRRMKFKCCQDPAYTTKSCGLTRYLNSWDAKLRYAVPKNEVIVGWFSIHQNDRQDRMHKFMECGYIPKESPLE